MNIEADISYILMVSSLVMVLSVHYSTAHNHNFESVFNSAHRFRCIPDCHHLALKILGVEGKTAPRLATSAVKGHTD